MTQTSQARTLASLTAVLLLAAAPAFSADRAVEKPYALPEHGTFKMNVPAGWKDQLAQTPPSAPPTITFTPADGKPFQVLVTPLWRPSPDVKLPTKETVRKRVENDAAEFKDDSVEQKVKIVEMKGKTGPGYYFSVTDKAPKPGEYKFLTEGLLMVSELMVAFTILTNDGQEQVVRDALAMVRSATHAPK
jgi:hypothetical protein